MSPPEPPTRGSIETPLWLSHHRDEHAERCITVGRFHVCRRCSVLYPVAALVMVLVLVVDDWPAGIGPVLLVLLPLPAVVEFVLEQLGRISYRPRRQVAVTVPLGAALGIGFARYLNDPTDLAFWGVVLGYGGLCIASVLWRILDERAL